MATTTTNLGLYKPDYEESADIARVNGNMDIIDGAIADKITNPADPSFGLFLQIGLDGNPMWGEAASPSVISDAVEEWMDEHIPEGTTIAIDTSLSMEGYAADAKAVGDALASITISITDDGYGNVTIG